MKERKVCLVGFARPSRNETPWDDESYEFWGCNEGYVLPFPKIDRWFQIHPFVSFSRSDNQNDPKHFEWLQKEHPFDIYMQRKYQFVPSSVGYPIDELDMMFNRKYFRSSFDFMIAMALAEGYTTIGMYGFDMASGTEYGHQRPSAEYWLGRAEGMGVTIEMPLRSNLLRGSVYGFGDNSVGFRQQLEIRKALLDKQQVDANNEFQKLNGACDALDKIRRFAVAYPDDPLDVTKAYSEEQEKMIKQGALLNLLNGAKMEVDVMLKIFDGHSGSTIKEEKEDGNKKEESNEQLSGASGTPEQQGQA